MNDNITPTERTLADKKMVDDAFQHLLDTYLASRHRKKVDIITEGVQFRKAGP